MVDLSSLTIESQEDVEHFSPTLDEAGAVEAARSGLITAVLRSPGWSAKPRVGSLRSVELLQYPFWVYYFERRRGLLDAKLLDAVTGRPTGGKVKDAMMAAFVEARGRSAGGAEGAS